MDFIPLARAAALAHARLFSEQPARDAKRLDLLALALSSKLALYQRDMESGGLRRLTDAEIQGGRFTRGATTLEYPNRAPLRFLVVSRGDLDAALEQLKDDPLAASLGSWLRPRCASTPVPASDAPRRSA